MTTQQELQVQEKQEVSKPEESTVPSQFYVPHTDIYESEAALTLVMEMPGVGKDNVSINLENDQLRIEGVIDFSKYDGMDPVYSEYNVGHYIRTFSISNKIDQEKIGAEMKDGVLTLVLPVAESVKPRKIAVN